ncbi:hypothetical protein NDU88_007802 [Pleurodeles waltl]|uniref:Uncharacterized protein n=1 Tax=Pleurodeles waltl TaxID=8319 RepID=A0AAV7PMB8_PLEWA|nr:hypothetical protein NDU88_007802 [Pleurodeles waltl]
MPTPPPHTLKWAQQAASHKDGRPKESSPALYAPATHEPAQRRGLRERHISAMRGGGGSGGAQQRPTRTAAARRWPLSPRQATAVGPRWIALQSRATCAGG